MVLQFFLPSRATKSHNTWTTTRVSAQEQRTDDENRAFRRAYLEACMGVARMKYRNADDVIGIATESGASNNRRSEDALYLDARNWSAEDDNRAREDQQNLRVLVAERGYRVHTNEYPISGTPRAMPLVGKNPRNKPCFCGSGQKYKHCHGGA